MRSEESLHPYINYLYGLAKEGNRGSLADLRKGLTGQPGQVPATFPYVAPWVPEDARNTWRESVFYLTATLFAYYQAGGSSNALISSQGNLGNHFKMLKDKREQSASFEKRFSNLLKAHRDDLPALLRQALSLLRNEDIPINWDQLFKDLTYWNSENQNVQRAWANSYWRYQPKKDETEAQIEEEE